jgi:pSer/pThr/pTyr-binding forkhead associated (FHA) protein
MADDDDDPFSAVQLVLGPPDTLAVPVPEYPGILIGRSGESPFAGHPLLQDNVSRSHARVWRQEDGVILVQDEGSTNGTWVGAQRLTPGKPVTLHPTQELRLATQQPVRLRLDHD